MPGFYAGRRDGGGKNALFSGVTKLGRSFAQAMERIAG